MRYLFLFLFGLMFQFQGWSSHNLGGQIRYESQGGYKYRLVATVWRDCRGVSHSTPDFGVFSGLNGGNGCGSYSLTGFTLVSVKEITVRCSTVNPQCKPQNTYGTGEGVEEYTYTKNIDLSTSPFSNFLNKSSCCEITFYMRWMNRTGYTSGCSGGSGYCEDFFTLATMNICNLKKCADTVNNSLILKGKPIMFPGINIAMYHSCAAKDIDDDDSIKFLLKPGLKSLPSGSISYSSPFSYQYFMTPYCVPPTNIKCSPNTKTDPPRGTYFDTITGDLMVTPTANEIFTYVPGYTEYRKDTAGKWIEIGRGRRDQAAYVSISHGYNKSPKIDGPSTSTVCLGEKLCFDIKCSDETFTPNQTVPDTVAVWWDTAIRNASFSIKNPKDREKTAQFCWEPHDSDYRDTRYRFTVYTSDQHCDYTTISSKTFLVKVGKKATGKMDIQKGPCGSLYLSAQKDSSYSGDATFQWQIKNSANAMVLNSKKPKDTLSYLPEGDYYIKLTTNNKVGCATYSFDTIHLGPLPHVYLGADTFVCDKTNFQLSPKSISHATAPYTYNWKAIGNKTFTDTNSFFNLIKASKDTTIALEITDSLGCVFRDTIVVLLKSLPQLDAGENKVICTYQTAQLKATAKPEYGAFLWSTNDTVQSISTNKKGTYTITYTEPEFSCKNTDSVVVIVNDTVRAIAGDDQSICGSGSVTFNAQHQPVNWAVNYLWTDLTNNTDISTKSKLDITKSNTVLGAADLVYRYKLKVTLSQNGLVCTNSDTAKLTVHSKPLVKWKVPKIIRCHSEGDFLLEPFIEQPDSTLWLNGRFRIYGSGGNYNLVDSIKVNEHWGRLTYLDNESDLNGGKSFTQKITVWAQDTNGCANSSTIDLRINGNPLIHLDTSYYCQDKGFAHLDSSVLSPKTKFGNAQKWEVLSAPSGVDPTKVLIDSSGTGTKWVLLFGKPSENFYSGNYQLKFTVKDLVSGCQSQETTEVRVFPEPILSATDPQPFCKFGHYDLTSIFLADNKPPSAQNSGFKIHSFNGNTDSKEFGSAMINKNIFTADKAGLWNFIVKNTETGCESTDTFRLESKDNPQALFSILPSDSVSIDNTTIKFSNLSTIDSQDPLAYSWFFNYPSLGQSSNLPSPWYTYPKADSSYTIRLIAQTYWCSDTMEKILVVGNGHWNSINPIFIQAIHFDNFFKPLGLEGKNYLLQVYDVTGKMVGHTKSNMGLSLSAGNYFYVLQVENGREKPLVFRGQHAILAP